MEQDNLLNADEQEVLDLLVKAWSSFVKLEVLYANDANLFAQAIDQAHSIVMSRPVMRQQKEKNG